MELSVPLIFVRIIWIIENHWKIGYYSTAPAIVVIITVITVCCIRRRRRRRRSTPVNSVMHMERLPRFIEDDDFFEEYKMKWGFFGVFNSVDPNWNNNSGYMLLGRESYGTVWQSRSTTDPTQFHLYMNKEGDKSQYACAIFEYVQIFVVLIDTDHDTSKWTFKLFCVLLCFCFVVLKRRSILYCI